MTDHLSPIPSIHTVEGKGTDSHARPRAKQINANFLTKQYFPPSDHSGGLIVVQVDNLYYLVVVWVLESKLLCKSSQGFLSAEPHLQLLYVFLDLICLFVCFPRLD